MNSCLLEVLVWTLRTLYMRLTHFLAAEPEPVDDYDYGSSDYYGSAPADPYQDGGYLDSLKFNSYFQARPLMR